MQPLAIFFENNIVVIYFFYGLAFFCMGLFVWLESGRASSFRLARAMGPLAGFGIIHGLHEWFAMFQRMQDTANIPEWLLSDSLRLAHLVVSFLLLIVFGIRLVYANRLKDDDDDDSDLVFAYIAAGSLLLVWGLSSLITRAAYQLPLDEWLIVMDVLSRYILGIPGALLAAWAIVLEQRAFQRQALPETGRDLLRAALALFLYGVVGQIFVYESFIFPANIINSSVFFQTFGIPVQLFRAALATIMAIFFVRAMRAFELERQQRLAEANEARLVAQQRALQVQQQAREESEQLNRSLSRALDDLTVLYDFSRRLGETLNRNEMIDTAVTAVGNSITWVKGSAVILRAKSMAAERVSYAAGVLSDNDQWSNQITAITEAVADTQSVSYWCCNRAMPAEAIKPPGEACGDRCQDGCLLGLPLPLQSHQNSSLVLLLERESLPLGRRELSLLSTIAAQLGIAIDNATLYEVVQQREALRGELLHQVVSAQEQERQRVARELHDGTGQTLTAMGLGFAAVSATVKEDSELASQQLRQLKEMSVQALNELRLLISDLRPSLLDDLGLVPALQSQVNEFVTRLKESGHKVALSFALTGDERRLDPDVETIAFRIVQEALTNIAKHAAATAVDVTVDYRDTSLALCIRDNGRGFRHDEYLNANGQEHSWGLLGMQERVALVGGQFALDSTPGEGTTIEVCLPFINEGAKDAKDSFVVGG